MAETAKKAMRLGPFVKVARPEMIEAIAFAGFDLAVVDMEHVPVSQNDLYPLVLAAERRNLQLIVRIPAREQRYFMWCLDLGIRHIQVPFVETAQDVATCVENSYFSPQGMRGLCRFVRAADFSAKPRDEYLAGANQSTQLIFQVEGQRGVANVPEILDAVPKGSVLFIGPYDLSQSEIIAASASAAAFLTFSGRAGFPAMAASGGTARASGFFAIRVARVSASASSPTRRKASASGRREASA